MRSTRDLPKRIAKIRTDANLSQTEFGKRIGVSQPTVSAMESSPKATSTQSVKTICATFHISEEYLLYGEGEAYSKTSELMILYYRMTEYEQNIIMHLARSLTSSQPFKIDDT